MDRISQIDSAVFVLLVNPYIHWSNLLELGYIMLLFYKVVDLFLLGHFSQSLLLENVISVITKYVEKMCYLNFSSEKMMQS